MRKTLSLYAYVRGLSLPLAVLNLLVCVLSLGRLGLADSRHIDSSVFIYSRRSKRILGSITTD